VLGSRVKEGRGRKKELKERRVRKELVKESGR
jgi:hypothetical protein